MSNAAFVATMRREERPLVMHVVYRFDIGGLENGVVNLVNHMPADAYRHVVVSLTEVTDFRRRIRRDDVRTIALHKPPGQGFWQYPQLFRLFRELRPSVLHTRNMAALEAVAPAWLAGVPVRVHGEHGRDGIDLVSSRYGWVRRAYRPFVSHYIALSADLEQYLAKTVKVPRSRLSQFYNGVDADKFTPAPGSRPAILGCPFDPSVHWLVGTVGRMQPVKDQPLLARAFVRALEHSPQLHACLRLVMVGDGALKPQVMQILQAAGVAELAWLPGERNDIADILRGLDAFVLPSQSEGISNVVLEAMASGLPVVATAVGGNPELIEAGRTGELVPARDAEAMARAIVALAVDPERAGRLGREARAEVERRFSLLGMVSRYQGLYDRLLGRSTLH